MDKRAHILLVEDNRMDVELTLDAFRERNIDLFDNALGESGSRNQSLQTFVSQVLAIGVNARIEFSLHSKVALNLRRRVARNQVTKLREILRPFNCSLYQNITTIIGITTSLHKFHAPHSVKRPSDYRFGYIQLAGKTTHGVRRRFKINGKQNGDLTSGKIWRFVQHQIKIYIVPKL